MGYREGMSTSARPAEPSNELHRLVAEQAALRRVATLVASGASSSDVFEAVAREVVQVLDLRNAWLTRFDEDDTVVTVLAVCGFEPDTLEPGSRWPLDGPSMSLEVLRTGRPSRVENYTGVPGTVAAKAREQAFNRVVGAPITVEGRVWGLIGTSSPDAPLPDDLEDRLSEFTELVATAIANSQAHDTLTRLADEQAALRRVATLVASGAPSLEVFSTVAQEVAQVMDLPMVGVYRYDDDGLMTVVATLTDRPHVLQPGTRWPLDGESMVAQVYRTGRPARIEDYTDLPGPLAAGARESSLNATAGAPIIVNGAVWGAMGVSSPDAPLPDRTEDRLAKFTELVATAIANSQAHDELTRLADQQAALRRVATQVAAGAPPATVFEVVSTEVAALIGAEGAALTRFEEDGTVTAVSGWTAEGGYIYVGRRYELEGTVSGLIFQTRRPGRVDNYANAPGEAPEAAREMGWHSSVGAPITVDGRLWGVLAVISRSEQPLAPDTEQRLSEFAELVATAIANSEAHEQLAQLADEQAALRRVATLVAEGATPHQVFDSVRHEVARMFSAQLSVLLRYDAGGTAVVLATSAGYLGPVGRSWPLDDDHGAIARVYRTGLPARVDYTRAIKGLIPDAARAVGVRCAVGVPVVVDRTLWGVMAVGSREPESLPSDFEDRLAKFTELLATAIANAEGRAELDASRARIVATADATRRRIERDLHDGAQQQLVWLALALRAAQATVPDELEQHRGELDRVVEGLAAALDDLREVALGIHPAGLSEDGLTPALKRLVARSPLRVNLDCRADDRFPEPVEVTAYYVVSESLTNAAKYADTPVVDVTVDRHGSALRVHVRDGGRGGADPSVGSGLLGLKDRVEAIGGTMRLTSPLGAGTALNVELPLHD
jgi:GAF domain-containing protein